MTTPQPTLHGTKVLLRAWAQNDAEFVYAACQDAQIQRWVPIPSPYGYPDALHYLTTLVPAAWHDGGAVFAVVSADTGQLAGSIGAHSVTDGVAHVGYWTAAEARGRGLTTEALRVLARWFLTEREAARVELVVEPANVASARVAEGAGFVFEGVLRQRMSLRNRRIDVAMYSALLSDLG